MDRRGRKYTDLCVIQIFNFHSIRLHLFFILISQLLQTKLKFRFIFFRQSSINFTDFHLSLRPSLLQLLVMYLENSEKFSRRNPQPSHGMITHTNEKLTASLNSKSSLRLCSLFSISTRSKVSSARFFRISSSCFANLSAS